MLQSRHADSECHNTVPRELFQSIAAYACVRSMNIEPSSLCHGTKVTARRMRRPPNFAASHTFDNVKTSEVTAMQEPSVMPEPPDYELRNESTTPSALPTPHRCGNLWLIALAVLGLLGLIYFALRERPPLPLPQLNGPPRAGGAAPESSRAFGR